MPRFFLSYHSADQGLAERLKSALERRDARVYFAPASVRAGGFWSRTLGEQIAEADAFILLVGEKGVGAWQMLEYHEALDKHVKSPDFPVILLVLEGQIAPSLPFLRQLHWLITPDPSSEKDVARLFDVVAGIGARTGDLWRYTSPYRGLAAMEEKDSAYFFGRERETVDALSALAAAPDHVAVLLGNSGVGKSSLAQAGVIAALKRQAWPEDVGTAPEWPHAFQDSRRWCFLALRPGTMPLRALVETLVETWQLGVTAERVKQQNGWIELLRDGQATLPDLLDEAGRRYKELDQPEPPAFLLYIDQAEELYVRAEERERRRFSEVIVQGVTDPRLYILMSLRSDFLGELQRDEPLFKVHRKIDVPPLREAELHKVVSRPAALLGARFETNGLADGITRRAAEDSVKDAGALPLLSYTLDDMWTQMVKRADGVLRLPAEEFELGGVLVARANAFLATRPNYQDELRRIFTLKLATVREGEEPTRRRARRSEFSEEEWRLVSELTDHPNRLLVTATPEGGEPYAEVAHEAIFQRWDSLREWVLAEREFLAWRTGFEAAQRTWRATPDSLKKYAMLMGLPLAQAKRWSALRREDITAPDRAFVADSIKYWGRITLPRERIAIVESVKQWGAIILPREKIPSESPKRPIPAPRGSKIFISYRRLDTGQIAGRIYDRLAREIPQDEIFFDIDTIPPGVDFKQHISKAVSSSAVLLVLIGEKWVIPTWKRSAWGFGSKLKEDFVKLEIESALDLGVPILPLLVDNRAMPDEGDLPSSIADFVGVNAAAVRSGRDFHKDMDRVLDTIASHRRGVSAANG
jgi:conflict system STAND superfamily ATPase/TIR domain-containing protein